MIPQQVFTVLGRYVRESGCFVWLNGGVLLGLIRDGRPLDHDTDIDLSFWARDQLQITEKLFPLLLKNGFQPGVKFIANNGQEVEYNLTYQGVKIEFFLNFERGAGICWYCFGGKIQYLRGCRKHVFSQQLFADEYWWIPDPPEQYLEDLYGRNWRIKDPHYDYKKSPSTIITSPRIHSSRSL